MGFVKNIIRNSSRKARFLKEGKLNECMKGINKDEVSDCGRWKTHTECGTTGDGRIYILKRTSGKTIYGDESVQILSLYTGDGRIIEYETMRRNSSVSREHVVYRKPGGILWRHSGDRMSFYPTKESYF